MEQQIAAIGCNVYRAHLDVTTAVGVRIGNEVEAQLARRRLDVCPDADVLRRAERELRVVARRLNDICIDRDIALRATIRRTRHNLDVRSPIEHGGDL